MRYLLIYEVSKKQDYIFSSKLLRENVSRSENIAYVTSPKFLLQEFPEQFDENKNLINAGGGHTVLQFDSREEAAGFAQDMTLAVLQRWPDIELFTRIIPVDETKTTLGDAIKELTRQLEIKKSRRETSFRRLSYGVEKLDRETFRPKKAEEAESKINLPSFQAPAGWNYPVIIDELCGRDSYAAIIHIDGNAMGKRVQKVYDDTSGGWDECRHRLQAFSSQIMKDFESAFGEMVNEVIAQKNSGTLDALELKDGKLPVRPVILAGDDVCFITAGSIGLECARVFLEKLSHKSLNGTPYSACAGITIVNKKYPFHAAYGYSEELCDNAKRFSAACSQNKSVSAMDWHIEFGQLRSSLSEQRASDYVAEDGNLMTLRPVSVVVPSESAGESGDLRSYDYFRALCSACTERESGTARSKMKRLRGYLRQGETESSYYIVSSNSAEIYRTANQKLHLDWLERVLEGDNGFKNAYAVFPDGKKRCTLFDAIELSDHYIPFCEVRE